MFCNILKSTWIWNEMWIETFLFLKPDFFLFQMLCPQKKSHKHQFIQMKFDFFFSFHNRYYHMNKFIFSGQRHPESNHFVQTTPINLFFLFSLCFVSYLVLCLPIHHWNTANIQHISRSRTSNSNRKKYQKKKITYLGISWKVAWLKISKKSINKTKLT